MNNVNTNMCRAFPRSLHVFRLHFFSCVCGSLSIPFVILVIIVFPSFFSIIPLHLYNFLPFLLQFPSSNLFTSTASVDILLLLLFFLQLCLSSTYYLLLLLLLLFLLCLSSSLLLLLLLLL